MPVTPNRSDLFRRAHQLVSWNGNKVREMGRAGAFSHFLRYAWAEFRAGKLPSFAPEAVAARKAQSIRDHIVEIRNKNYWNSTDHKRIEALYAELQTLIGEEQSAPALKVAA